MVGIRGESLPVSRPRTPPIRPRRSHAAGCAWCGPFRASTAGPARGTSVAAINARSGRLSPYPDGLPPRNWSWSPIATGLVQGKLWRRAAASAAFRGSSLAPAGSPAAESLGGRAPAGDSQPLLVGLPARASVPPRAMTEAARSIPSTRRISSSPPLLAVSSSPISAAGSTIAVGNSPVVSHQSPPIVGLHHGHGPLHRPAGEHTHPHLPETL